jgi:hypothetical protein
MPRFEIPISRSSTVIDGRPVFIELGAHSVDTDWPTLKGRMTMKLFTVGKVGCFCEAVAFSTETRRGEIVKIAVVQLKVEPFDHKLATAMGCEGVRQTLFKLGHPDPNPILGSHIDLAVGMPRQILKVFEAPDVAKGSIAFDQARIFGVHALGQKDASGFALRLKASFGPLSARELEFLNQWRLSQKFVSFDEAEPGMFDEPVEENEDDEPEPASGQTPMFDTEPDGKPVGACRPLQQLLKDAGAVILVSEIAAWTAEQCDEASAWATAQIAASAKDKAGHHTSVKWPAHVAAASGSRQRDDVPERAHRRLHSHQNKKQPARKRKARR